MCYLVVHNGFGCFLDIGIVVLDAHAIIGAREVVDFVAAFTTDVESILGDTYLRWLVPASNINKHKGLRCHQDVYLSSPFCTWRLKR